jgi:signal transduction histidine kinase
MKHIRFWIASVVVVYVSVFASWAIAQNLTQIKTLQLSKTAADALPELGSSPSSDSKTSAVTLPTRWREEGATKWFVVPVVFANIKDQAIFIPRASSRIELWVNGQFAGRWGQRGEASFDQGKHPILHSIDPMHLKTGANELWLRIEGDPTQTKGLSEMYVGNYSEAKLLYFGRWWREIGTAIAIVVACLVLGLFGLWFGLRLKTHYFISFGLAAFGWALQSMPTLFASSGLSYVILFILAEIGFGVFVSQIQIFAIQQMGINNKYLLWNAKLLFLASLVIAPIAYATPSLTGKILDAYHALLLLSALLTMPFIAVRAFKEQTTANWILLLASITGIAFGAYDFVNIQLSDQGYSRYSITRFSALIFLLSMIAILLEKQIRSAQLERHLNDELKDKIGEREAELHALHAQESRHTESEIKRYEAEKVAMQLHDGLGGKLSALQFLLQDPKFDHHEGEQLVKDALSQLHTAVGAGAISKRDLPSIMGYHVYRFQDAFVAANIRVTSSADSPPAGSELSPTQATHLGVLVRGVFENVLKHAKASELTIQVTYNVSETIAARLVIKDNGIGFNVALAKQGVVLSSLKRNANRLGAQISLKSNAESGGARMTLEWAAPVSISA